MNKDNAGLTLIELLVALIVGAMILAVGIPAMFDFVRENRLTTAANAFAADMRAARMEALKQRQRVTMCASANQASCGGEWHMGWVVFIDENGNAELDAGETVLRVQPALPDRLSFEGNGPVTTYISYLPTGLPRQISGALQMGSLVVCEAPSGRRIVINAMGRTRIEKTAC